MLFDSLLGASYPAWGKPIFINVSRFKDIMASTSSKKVAAANEAALLQLHRIAAAVNAVALIAVFYFRRPASVWPFLVLSVPSWISEMVIQRTGVSTYVTDAVTGQPRLVRAGEDILHEGLYEYLFDTIYVTWIIDALMVVFGTNRVWWLILVVPGFVVFKLALLAKNYFGTGGSKEKPAAAAAPEKSKRQTKMEARGAKQQRLQPVR